MNNEVYKFLKYLIIPVYRGIVVAEVRPEIEERFMKGSVNVPENFHEDILILKGIYDDEEKEIIPTDFVKFKAEKRGTKDVFYLNKLYFDYLSEIFFRKIEKVIISMEFLKFQKEYGIKEKAGFQQD